MRSISTLSWAGFCCSSASGNAKKASMRARIEAFFALPLAELQQNPAQLKAEMDRIASEIV